MGHNPAIPIDHARQPVTPALERLQASAPARFAGTIPSEAIFPLVPDAAMRYGIYDARGYDYPIEKRFDSLWQRTVSPATPFAVHTIETPITGSSLRTLSLLGVEQLMQQTEDKPLDRPGCGSPTRGRMRGSTRTSARCRGPGWWASSGWSRVRRRPSRRCPSAASTRAARRSSSASCPGSRGTAAGPASRSTSQSAW